MSSRSPVVRLILAGFFLAPGLVAAVWLLLLVAPDRALDAFLSRSYSLTVTDRDGVRLQTVPLQDGLWRAWTPVDRMPELLVRVFLESEDVRFYVHPGVDPISVARAARQNSRAGAVVSGGSTITMQLARLIRPHGPGFGGKLAEGWYALRIEAKLSKNEILGLWLNNIPFGSQIEGVTSAARHIFNVEPAELSVEQILLLAVVPRRPARYDPRLQPDAAAERAAALAARVGIDVSPESVRAAAASAVDADARVVPVDLPAPHFVRYVVSHVADEDRGRGGALTTSLDIDVQRALTAAIRARVVSARHFRIGNGAGIAIDNRTGEVLGYVGSVDFSDIAASGQIDGVRIARQPGSTLKPYLYALALERGFTAATILPDIPTEFGTDEVYIPENFNRRFNGPVRLRTALASSLNVPAVYTLERIGVATFADFLLELGFRSLENQLNSVGTGLALGNAEVTLAELGRAFTVFVRDGTLPELRWTPGSADESISEQGPAGRRVMATSTAGIIRSILSDDIARVPGFGTRSVLDTAFQAMFKTGTSSQFNNIWALGSSARMTVAVWMGNFSGETVIGAPGSSLPAAAVIEVLGLFTRPGSMLSPPEGVVPVDICATSGMRATDACPAVVSEIFRPGHEPPECTWHTGIHEPVRYPPEYQSWASDRQYLFRGGNADGDVRIVTPADGSVFYLDPSIPRGDQAVRVEVIAGNGRVGLFVNDAFMTEGASPLVAMLPLRRGTADLTAVGANGADRITIMVR